MYVQCQNNFDTYEPFQAYHSPTNSRLKSKYHNDKPSPSFSQKGENKVVQEQVIGSPIHNTEETITNNIINDQAMNIKELESKPNSRQQLFNIVNEELSSLKCSARDETQSLQQHDTVVTQVDITQKNKVLPSLDQKQLIMPKKQVDFSQVISQDTLNPTPQITKKFFKSQSNKQIIYLPKLKVAMQQNKKELEIQKEVISKIVQDKNYLLSLEYLYDKHLQDDEETQIYNDLKQKYGKYGTSQSNINLLKNEKRNSLGNTLSKQASLNDLSVLKKSSLNDTNHYSINLQENGQKLKFRNLKPLLNEQLSVNNRGLFRNQSDQLFKVQSLTKDKSPLQVQKAYQDFIDTTRDQKASQEIKPYNDQKPQMKSGSYLEKMNQMRQKLSSSNGTKHFIVAYNLSETLREHQLELECNDYKKIKDLITDLTHKRFETRTNNVKKKKFNSLDMSKEQMDKFAAQMAL